MTLQDSGLAWTHRAPLQIYRELLSRTKAWTKLWLNSPTNGSAVLRTPSYPISVHISLELTYELLHRLAPQVPVELPPLKPTPPPSPIRRDSTTAEMSEEVAALERELIMPEYRKASSLSQEIAAGSSAPQASSSTSMAIDEDEDPPHSAASSSRPKSIPNSAPLSAPLTFRSRTFLAGEDSQPTPTSSTLQAFPDTIQNVDLAVVDPAELEKMKADEDLKMVPIAGHPVPYPPSLPPLPDYLLKNRLNVGGLARKKARERANAQQNPQAANASATSSDLYKLGISKANHQSVRQLLGAGAPAPGKSRIGSKVLTTTDWNVAVAEMQTQRAVERIEQLKADKTWSLRQVRKQRAPGTQKAHWDYLLDEMKWLAVDFRQETRWKMAAAYEISRSIMEWHNAPDASARAELCPRIRPPRFLPAAGQGQEGIGEIDMDEQTKAGKEPDTTIVDDGPADEETSSATKAIRRASQSSADATGTPTTATAALPNPPPRQKRYQNQLVTARAPVFDLPSTQTVYTLSASALPETYRELASYEVVNELFQDLPLYQGPSEPSSDPRQNRRIDEASPHHSRITHTSHFLESKPLLVSTLMPSRKRKRSGDWKDMMDVAGEEGRDYMTDMFGSTQDIVMGNGQVRPKDSGNKRFNPAPPPNAEARSASMDWSPEEDRQLFIFTRQYSFNWDLVAHIFNSATKRSKGDERLPWDCFDRWNKKFAPPTPTPTTAALPASAVLPPAAANAPANAAPAPSPVPGTPALPGAPVVASPGQSQLPPHKRDRRVSSTAVSGPAAGVPTPTVAVARKPEMAKSMIRHISMVEATKKLQKRREIQQKQSKYACPSSLTAADHLCRVDIPPAVRKVNLNSHESHNQPYHPGLTALDLLKMKAERERIQMEETRKREQARMYQQAQAAAMAQQHQMAQAAQRGQMPMQGVSAMMHELRELWANQLLQPNVRLPPGAMQNMQANQAALLQSQRALSGGQMSQAQLQAAAAAAAAAAMQQQQGQNRPLQPQPPGGHMQRPPSSAGPNQQQMPHLNGNQQSSPPLQQQQGLQANMLPMQMGNQRMISPNTQGSAPSQSPQNGQMQLSPQQQQLQLQLQQAAANGGLPSPAAQQVLLAQLAAVNNRTGSPMQMQQPQLPQGQQPLQIQANLTPEQQQQVMAAFMRMQSRQASSQGGGQ